MLFKTVAVVLTVGRPLCPLPRAALRAIAFGDAICALLRSVRGLRNRAPSTYEFRILTLRTAEASERPPYQVAKVSNGYSYLIAAWYSWSERRLLAVPLHWAAMPLALATAAASVVM